jgi:hypothetical protein
VFSEKSDTPNPGEGWPQSLDAGRTPLLKRGVMQTFLFPCERVALNPYGALTAAQSFNVKQASRMRVLRIFMKVGHKNGRNLKNDY